jgi:hypothetical protein
MAVQLIEFEFDKEGVLLTERSELVAVQALTALGTDGHAIVISHGWNNDINEARALYRAFLAHVEQLAGAAASRVVALGILWPSKRFADADLIPGGAASTDADPVADQAIRTYLQEMKGVFEDPDADDRLDAMKSLVTELARDRDKQRKFVALLGEITDRHLDYPGRTALTF